MLSWINYNFFFF